MIWELLPDLLWLFWYCTEQEVENQGNEAGVKYACMQCGVVRDAPLLTPLLVLAVCCSFCLWKDVPKGAAHGECPARIHCRGNGMRKYKAKHLWAQTLLHVLPGPLWHLYMINRKYGGAVEETAFGILATFSGKHPRYLSFVFNWPLVLRGGRFYEKKEKWLLPFPVFSLWLSTFHLPAPFLSHSSQQVHYLRMSHHPSLTSRSSFLLLLESLQSHVTSAGRSEGLETPNPKIPWGLLFLSSFNFSLAHPGKALG